MDPITRGEIFLARAAGEYDGDLPTPQTRAEHFLKDIGDRLDGIDEEMKNIEPVSPEDVNSALADYIDEHGTDAVRLRCSRAGGFVDLFGTANSDTIHELVEEDDYKASLVWNTMLYQICKMIGEMSTVLCGKVDGILLTGGLLRFDDVRATIEKRCGFIAPISVYPGEMEQEALALPALEVLRGQKEPLTYTGKNVWNGFKGIDL